MQPYHNDSVLEAQYQELLVATSCSSLECLRSIDETSLNKGAEAALLAGYQTKPKLYSYGDYYFGPSVDGEYVSPPSPLAHPQLTRCQIRDIPSHSLALGHFTKVPLLVDTEGYEGYIFSNASQTTFTEEKIDLQSIFPTAKPSFFTRLFQLYPTSSFNSTLFQRQSIFGNFIIDCPTYNMVAAVSDWGSPAYKLIFDAGTELHGATRPFLHSTNASEINNATLALIMKDWYASFAVSLNPNAVSYSGMEKPHWPAYGDTSEGGFSIMSVNYTMMGAQPDPDAAPRCDFFRGQSAAVRN